ncbi:MAG: tripartite tricarboxylate transporter substrate binding protein [Betaproteobacteria bacterium]|nr:tripartite tricarboxylate transporter substrate binding protein [Betaproteobacteria bacterium]
MKRHQADRPSGFVLAVIAALLPAMAMAQTYPSKPIRIVVGFSAGGSADLVARVAGSKLSDRLGQSVIVDNRPGAGGNIAAELVAKSPADGYTLLVAPSAFAVNPSLYRKVPYDAIKDFDPVTTISTYMLFLVCHPSLPVRSVKELIALAKAKPGHLNYSSAGTGTTTHISGELLSYMAGVKMTHIPYKGTGQQLPALLSGEVALAFGSTTVVPLIQARKIILLAVTGAQRFPGFPDAPTIAEAAVPGYEVTSWNALFAPAGTPAAIVKRISEEVGKGLRQADALEIFNRQGLQEAAGTPEAVAALVAAELAKWGKVIKAAGIPLQ